MPRKLTEEDIQAMKDYLYQKGVFLIKQKGVRNITVDDITQSAAMAKGSFYRYYSNKEEFLYAVLKRNEKNSMEQMLSIQKEEREDREKVVAVFRQIFLSEDSLFSDTEPEDLEYLLLRLPKEVREREMKKSRGNFSKTVSLLGISETEENYGVVSYLMNGMQAIRKSPGQYGEQGRKRATEILIQAFADFIEEEREKKNRENNK